MIKISLIVLAGFAAAWLLRHRSAAIRHWVLSVAIACAAITPYLETLAPAWDLRSQDAPVAAAGPSSAAVSRTAASPAGSTPAPGVADRWIDRVRGAVAGVALPAWLAGALTSLAILLIGFARMAWLASRAKRVRHGRWPETAAGIARAYGLRRPVTLLRSEHPTLTVTWGALRPKVILPRDSAEWSDDRVRIVLAHELAHIRRGDWLAQMVAEIMRAVYWFNPLFWLAARRLRHESEQACDDAVLALGVEGHDYAGHLLALARAVRQHRQPLFPGFPAPAMVRPSSLERRINAMLNTRVNRQPPALSLRIAATLALLSVTVVVGGFGGAAQTFARFAGSVIDPMNGGIPRVTLVLVNTRTDAKHEVRSDENGRFEFVGLPAGDYLLEARYPGFATFKGTLTVGAEDVQRNLALQLGTLQETITVRGSASAPSSPQPYTAGPQARPRSASECTTSGTGGDIRPPRKLRDVRPVYPQQLQSAGVTGTVTYHGRIGTDGLIRDLRVIQTPHAGLAAAGADAIRQWEFDTTLLNCVPVEVEIGIRVTFELE